MPYILDERTEEDSVLVCSDVAEVTVYSVVDEKRSRSSFPEII